PVDPGRDSDLQRAGPAVDGDTARLAGRPPAASGNRVRDRSPAAGSAAVRALGGAEAVGAGHRGPLRAAGRRSAGRVSALALGAATVVAPTGAEVRLVGLLRAAEDD